MLATLAQHKETDFQSLFTGDETWMIYESHHDAVRLASWEEPEKFQEPTQHQKKSMVTIFFNGVGQLHVAVLHQKQKMNSAYFIERILTGVTETWAWEEMTPKEKLTVHFDNAPIHKSETVREILTQWNSARMDQPAYSPDLVPCDFLLFGYLKQYVRDAQFSTEQEPANVFIGFLEAISPRPWSIVFENWKGRFQTCVCAGGIHFEQDRTNGVFRFCFTSLDF
jgi:hypothetical protein